MTRLVTGKLRWSRTAALIRRKVWGSEQWNLGSGSVRSSRQTVSDYTLRRWFPNIQQSRFLTACRRLEKLVLPSVFVTNLSFLRCGTCRLVQQQFWMIECDILRVQKYSDPSYIFSGGQDPRNLSGSTPLGPRIFRTWLCPSLIAQASSSRQL